MTAKQRKSRKQVNSTVDSQIKRLVLAAFCLSGFAGLMHQVVWAKLLAGLIGTTAHAQAAILAVFMGGLALGSVLFGKRVDRRGSPLRTYVALEVLIAIYCLVLPLLLIVTEFGYVTLAGYFFESTSFTFSLRFSLAFLLVLFPAVLMGGTLPVLSRHLVVDIEQTQKFVASLYALNSFGAVLGAATAGFFTLPLFGVHISLVTASALNLGAAALLFKPSRREGALAINGETAAPKQGIGANPVIYSKLQYQVTLVALALSGFAALGYEVIFTRVIALSFGSSAYSFTVMLISFITGISLGSAIISRVRVKRPLWLFGACQLFVVVGLLAITPFVSQLPYLIGLMRINLQEARFGFELYQLGKVGLCLVFLLLPTILLGIGFPLVAQIQAHRSPEIGYRVGSTYAWNTVGNVLGAVLTGLVLLPVLGLLGAFHFNLGLNLLAGCAVLLVALEVQIKHRLMVGVITLLVVIGYGAVGTDWLKPINFAPNHLRMTAATSVSTNGTPPPSHPTASFESWKRHYVVDPEKLKAFHFQEDAQTTVLAIDNGKNVTLYVNSKPDASSKGDLPTQVFLAQLPMFLAPEARNILVIGYGSGVTPGSALRHPVEHADIVEISPGVLNADALFAEFNYGVLDDPRVSTHLDDGQSFLRAVPRRYDMIISEPSNPWVAGISGLFTREFFQKMRGKLNSGGLAVVWFHAYEQSDEGVELVMRTIKSVFPHAIVGRAHTYSDIIVIASDEPFEPDYEAMENRFDQPAIRNDLARVGITNLVSLLIHYLQSQENYGQGLARGPLNTVSRQQLEYLAPRSLFSSESSSFLWRVDPLLKGIKPGDSTILGGYLDYRTAVGEPVRYEELEYIIDRTFENVAARLKQLPLVSGHLLPAPDRPSRGLVPDPKTAGLYEAAYWGSRFRREEQGDVASQYFQRFHLLDRAGAKQ